MNEEIATSTADRWINLILQHQPEAVYKGQLTNNESAQSFAEALCTFRQKTVDLLKKQPQ